MRIKEQETRLTLHEHDDDNDDDNNDEEIFFDAYSFIFLPHLSVSRMHFTCLLMLSTAIGESNRTYKGAEGEKVRGYRKMHIYELHVLCSSTDIIREIQ